MRLFPRLLPRLTLAGLLLLSGPLHAVIHPAPLVTASSAPTAGNPAANVVDQSTGEFESAAGTATFLEFDLGTVRRVDGWVNVTPQNAAKTVLNNRLIFDTDGVAGFNAVTDTVRSFTAANTANGGRGHVNRFAAVSARRVRWDVQTTTGSAAQGCAEVAFLDSAPGAVPVTGVTVINSSPAFSANFVAANAVNGIAGIGTGLAGGGGIEYASATQGANMFMDFDMGSPQRLVGFDYFDRLYPQDRVTAFNLIYSNSPSFSPVIATQSYSKPSTWTASATFPAVTARYVRLDVTGGAQNTGVGEMSFYTAPAIGMTGSAAIQRPLIITGAPGQSPFQVGYSFTASGYDIPAVKNVTYTATMRLLRGATNVPTDHSGTTAGTYTFQPAPSVTTHALSGTLSFLPLDLAALDPGQLHTVEVTISHEEPAGNVITDVVAVTAPFRPLRLSGRLLAGGDEGSILAASISGGTTAAGVFSTTLVIPSGGGVMPGVSGATFSSVGLPVSVNLATGDATMSAGAGVSVTVTNPTVQQNGVRYTLGSVSLNGTIGLTAESVRIWYPGGFGIGSTANSRRMAGSYMHFDQLNPVPLTSALVPDGLSLTLSAAWCAWEGIPVKFNASSIAFSAAAGTFTIPANTPVTYDRAAEAQRLSADTTAGILSSAAEGNRRTNDGYLRFAVNGGGTISADAAGAAVFAGNVRIGPGTCNPHYPSGALLQWNQTTDLTWNGTSTTGQLTVSPATALSQRQDYGSGVPGDPCSTGTSENRAYSATGGALHATPGGGLRYDATAGTQPLRWGARSGTFGWTVSGLSTGSFYMPGYHFTGASAYSGAAAAALLMTGRGQPGNPGYTELPGTAAYKTGAADYAGMNFRVALNPSASAVQVPGEAGTSLNYALKPCSKYVVNTGVTGRHESAATGASTVPLWGYTTQISGVAATFQESVVRESAGSGTLHIGTAGGPANFDLNLAGYRFGSTGELRAAVIAPGSPDVSLAYWGVTLTPLTCSFRFPVVSPADSCLNRQTGFPVLGVRANTGYFRQPLYGELGFHPNGNLVAASDPIAAGTGVSSRLRAPSQIRIEGNGGGASYGFTPVTGVAFNNWSDPDKPATGFLFAAGKLNVPFFEDLEMVAHISPSRPDSIYLMGAYPDVVKTAFTDTTWDAANRGWPAGVALDAYRAPTDENSPYHAKVARKWRGLNLDFAAHWQPLLRQFKVVGDGDVQRVFVMDVPTELRSLTPTVADIKFGVKFQDLPVLSSQDLLADHLEGFDQIEARLHAAVQAAGNAAYDAARIPQALAAVDQFMALDPAVLFDPVFDRLLPQSAVDTLYNQLKSAYTGADANLTNLHTRLREAAGFQATLTARLQLLQDASNSTSALAGAILPRLDAAESGIDAILELIAKSGPAGERTAVKQLILQLLAHFQPGGTSPLAQTISKALESGAAIANAEVNKRLPEADSALTNVERVLNGLKTRIGQLRAQINDGQAFMQRLANGVTVTLGSDLAQKVVDRICVDLQRLLDPARTALEQQPDEIRALIKSTVKELFLESPVVSNLRGIMRGVGNEVRELLQGGFDSLMSEANRIVSAVMRKAREALPHLPVLTVDTREFISMEGLKAADISGYARINGDSLEEVRLDGKYSMEQPDKMEFSGFVIVKNRTALNSQGACYGAGERGLDITLGGKAPLKGLGFSDGKVDGADPNDNKPLPTVAVQVMFAFNAAGTPIGGDGKFDITGPLKFGIIEADKISLGAGIGGDCTYLFGRAAGKLKGKEAQIALFAGGHVDIASLEVLPPKVYEYIDNQAPLDRQVMGFFGHASLWFSVNELFGIPDSCLFSAQAKLGQGVFGFTRPAWNALPKGPTSIGAVLEAGVRARILCLVDAKGELLIVPQVTLAPAVNAVPLNGQAASNVWSADGQLTLTGKLGSCPFCIEKSKTFDGHATYSAGDFSFSID